MGCLIGSAVVPIALCITWKKANGTGAIAGAILGFCAAIAGWIGITSTLNDGVITVDTTFGDYEMLTGNLLAIGVGGLVTVGWSLIRPANFDWEITRQINRVDRGHMEELAATPGTVTPRGDDKLGQSPSSDGEKEGQRTPPVLPMTEHSDEEQDRKDLQKAFRFASWSALTLVLILIILIPLPLFFSSYGEPPLYLDCDCG